MRDVIYFGSISVDGYIDAADGDSGWVVPDPELHRHFNELESSVGTHLYGRRMYELMAEYWPTADAQSAAPDYIVEYARIWQAMPKLVFSKTLARVDWNAELVRGDALEEVARLKRQPGKSMSVGGSVLATCPGARRPDRRVPLLCDAHHRRIRDAHLPHAEQTYRSHPRRSPTVHVGGGSPEVPPHRSERWRLTPELSRAAKRLRLE